MWYRHTVYTVYGIYLPKLNGKVEIWFYLAFTRPYIERFCWRSPRLLDGLVYFLFTCSINYSGQWFHVWRQALNTLLFSLFSISRFFYFLWKKEMWRLGRTAPRVPSLWRPTVHVLWRQFTWFMHVSRDGTILLGLSPRSGAERWVMRVWLVFTAIELRTKKQSIKCRLDLNG